MYRIRLKGIFSLFLAAILSFSLTVLPDKANAGVGTSLDIPISQSFTDTESSILVGYWDLRERDSYFQVTNTTGEAHRVHVQIYDATNNCVEFDYFDTLTPRDTHVYNVAELDRNNGVELSAPDLTDGHGIVAVTHVDGSDGLEEEPVLTGNFRINDNHGYRYQTNMAGLQPIQTIIDPPSNGLIIDTDVNQYNVNFNNIDNSTFSDLVVFNIAVEDNPGRVVAVPEVYEVTLYDENENPISCSPVLLGCFSDISQLDLFEGFFETHVNVGINQSVTNSRGGPSLCLGNDTTGFLELTPDSTNPFVSEVIFMGLNNEDGTGSIDAADTTVIGTTETFNGITNPE